MPAENHETTNFFVKAGIYLFGILLGLGVKLAKMHKEKPLTKLEFILHSIVAFACAWLVWNLLEHYNRLWMANIASVIVGRYGDQILLLIWKGVKNLIVSFIKSPPVK